MARLSNITVDLDVTINGTGYIEGTDIGDYIGVYSFTDEEWTWIPKDIPRKESIMKVTSSLRNSLIKSAEEDRVARAKEYQAAKSALDKATSALDEATSVLNWASSLRIGGELTTPTIVAPKIDINFKPTTDTQRYFIPSKSGLTKGHYIYRNTLTGSVDCSCPGFINRGTCWASNQIKTAWWNTNGWTTSASVFDNNRRQAYNVSYR